MPYRKGGAVWTRVPDYGTTLLPEYETPQFLALPGLFRPVLRCNQTFSFPADLSAGRLCAVNTGSVAQTVSVHGLGVPTSDGNGYSFFRNASAADAYVEIASGSDFTWIFQTDKIGYAGTNPGWLRSAGGAGNTFVLIPSSGLWVRQNGSDFTSSVAAPAAGSSVTVVVAVKSGQSVKAWINGVQMLNSTTATTTGDQTSVNGYNMFGRHNASGEYLTGNHTIVGLWNRTFPDARNQALSVNPFQMFAPAARRRIISGASAPADTLFAQSIF